MISSSFEKLIFVIDYFDDPITGVAFFHGIPHHFDAEFDDAKDSFTQHYRLIPLSEETMRTVYAARATWRQKSTASGPTAVQLENDWKALNTDMDKMIAHDGTLVSSLSVVAHFVRLHETGTDEESFAVAWTNL